MEKCVQFSVFLDNKPGVLSQIFRELGKAKVNISAMAMMDSMEHGVLRMILDLPDKGRTVLRDLNISVSESEVLSVTLPNKPGAAAELCDKLAAKHINVGYMYCTGAVRNGKTEVVIRVPDIKKATKIIESSKTTRRDMKVKLRRPTTKTIRRR